MSARPTSAAIIFCRRSPRRSTHAPAWSENRRYGNSPAAVRSPISAALASRTRTAVSGSAISATWSPTSEIEWAAKKRRKVRFSRSSGGTSGIAPGSCRSGRSAPQSCARYWVCRSSSSSSRTASRCSTAVARRWRGLSTPLEQPAAEEADDALFVRRGLGLDTAHVLGARNLPDLLWPALDLVELVVGRPLGPLALGPVDEEHRLVDLPDEALQVGRRRIARGERRAGGDDGGAEGLIPSATRIRQVVTDGAAAAALRDDRLQRVRFGGGLDHHLSADGEADAADPAGIDVGAALQELDGRVDVALTLPAEQIRVALALALAAPVEEQDSVAVVGQDLRPLLGGRAAGEGDDGRAVLRLDVPPLQRQAVARLELDVLVGSAQIRGRDVRAPDVGDDVRDGERERNDGNHDERAARHQQPARVPPPERVVRPPGLPQGNGADADQDEGGRSSQQRAVVVARGADLARVVEALDAQEQAEEGKQEREGGADAGAQARVGPRRPEQERGRDQAAREVVGRGGAGIRLQERVVHRVQGQGAECDAR